MKRKDKKESYSWDTKVVKLHEKICPNCRICRHFAERGWAGAGLGYSCMMDMPAFPIPIYCGFFLPRDYYDRKEAQARRSGG